MTEKAPEGFYVYQPLPPKPDGRIYAVASQLWPLGTSCKGLTRDEADIIAKALNAYVFK